MVEIIRGGNIQADLFNRMTLNSISKLQKDLQLRSFNDSAAATAAAATDENLMQNMPLVNSFFPFSRNSGDSNELTDLLAMSHEMLTEGSIFDGLSEQQD